MCIPQHSEIEFNKDSIFQSIHDKFCGTRFSYSKILCVLLTSEMKVEGASEFLQLVSIGTIRRLG